MTKASWFLMLLIVLVISLGFFTLKGFGREEKSIRGYDTRIISGKLDEVLKNQQDIIVRLKDIRSQQDIIRIRASRR